MTRALPPRSLALALTLATACSSFDRRMTYGTLDSPAMGREMAYAVYTPPGFTPDEHLPLVLFLHGGGDREDCFDRHGIKASLDAAITAGQAPRVVVVVPDGETGFWENFADGSCRYRDWVLQDLLPHVREAFHTLPGRQHEHVCGISMGGHGTLRIALLEGDRFGSAAAISAPVMDAEHLVAFTDTWWVRLFVPVERIWGQVDDLEHARRDDLFVQWQDPADLLGLRFMLVCGDEDRGGIVAGNRAFHEHLGHCGIAHDYLVYPGGHRWTDWRPILPAVLRFLVGPSVDAG